MRLLEFQSKKLLSDFGIGFSPSSVARSVQEAVEAATKIGGPVVLKAQVPFGGRGKLGAVRFVDSPESVAGVASELFSMKLRDNAVRSISVEPRLSFNDELYVGITWNISEKLPTVMLSRSGGVEIESKPRESIAQKLFDPRLSLQLFEGRELARSLNIPGPLSSKLGLIIQNLSKAFVSLDALLIEINPLVVLKDGALIGLDAHVELDDDAVGRQDHRLSSLGILETHSNGRALTSLEKQAKAIDASDHRGVAGRLIEFDGDLALLIGGGGASLTVFDAIRRYGGNPANYCEVGGNPTEEKVADLVKLLLSKPSVRKLAVIMNVVNNTRADVIARGMIQGIRSAGRIPAETVSIFRVPGSYEDEARETLAKDGIEAEGREISLDEASRLSVERMSYAAGR